jgi:S-methylmethionine-dependent homocysteine/selenocysteine methylase
MGTELRRRGARFEAPLWSAGALLDARDIVAGLHRDCLGAGSQILTTDTFGLGMSALASGFMAHRQSDLIEVAVELAEAARDGDPAFAHVRIAGSIAPSGATRPEVAVAEYMALARELAARCDVILLETFTSVAAGALAVSACRGFGRPVWLSFAVERDEDDGELRLVGGAPLAQAFRRIDEEELPDGLLFNCFAVEDLEHAGDVLVALAPGLPLGLCPHASGRDDTGRFVERMHSAESMADALVAVAERHPEIVLLGGCCGTGPELIAALRERVPLDNATLDQFLPR